MQVRSVISSNAKQQSVLCLSDLSEFPFSLSRCHMKYQKENNLHDITGCRQTFGFYFFQIFSRDLPVNCQDFSRILLGLCDNLQYYRNLGHWCPRPCYKMGKYWPKLHTTANEGRETFQYMQRKKYKKQRQ